MSHIGVKDFEWRCMVFDKSSNIFWLLESRNLFATEYLPVSTLYLSTRSRGAPVTYCDYYAAQVRCATLLLFDTYNNKNIPSPTYRYVFHQIKMTATFGTPFRNIDFPLSLSYYQRAAFLLALYQLLFTTYRNVFPIFCWLKPY